MDKAINIIKARFERYQACRQDAIKSVQALGGSSHHFEGRVKHFSYLIEELEEILDILERVV